MNIYFCHFNSIQSPSFTISFCTCNNNFLYRWKKSACGLKHLSNLNAQLPLSYCIVRRHTFGKSRIFLLPNNITPRTFHNSMYTLLSFHIYPHSISHLLKWKTTQGCYVQHMHVPRTLGLLCAYSHKHVQAYSNCVAIRVTTPYRVVLAGVCAALRRRSVRGVWEV